MYVKASTSLLVLLALSSSAQAGKSSGKKRLNNDDAIHRRAHHQDIAKRGASTHDSNQAVVVGVPLHKNNSSSVAVPSASAVQSHAAPIKSGSLKGSSASGASGKESTPSDISNGKPAKAQQSYAKVSSRLASASAAATSSAIRAHLSAVQSSKGAIPTSRPSSTVDDKKKNKNKDTDASDNDDKKGKKKVKASSSSAAKKPKETQIVDDDLDERSEDDFEERSENEFEERAEFEMEERSENELDQRSYSDQVKRDNPRGAGTIAAGGKITQAAYKATATHTSAAATGTQAAQETGGYATYFYQGGVAGACGVVHPDSALIAAIPGHWYGDFSSQSKYCNKEIKITAPSTGKSVTVTVADACPSCQNDNSIDLSLGAMAILAGSTDYTQEGQYAIQWSWV